MTTLLKAMLETARLMGTVREGTATGGSTTTLIDTLLDEPGDYFSKGTVWILSGANSGACKVVSTYQENTLAWSSALTGAIAAGVSYAVANPEYPKWKLAQAVLQVLRFDPILKTDDTLTVTANTEEYDLPSNVKQVSHIEVATNTSEPYSFKPNYNWRDVYGKLVFDHGKAPSEAGRIIRIWHIDVHGEIGESEDILPSVDIDWLKWKAVEYLYRDAMTRFNKDNPTDVELLNEAKQNALMAERKAKRYFIRNREVSPKLANY